MKTREWLYIVFIVILLQFIVQAAAWLYGGNSGALGYISFAGTIISIILAVLAIVYSYVQSISQQSSAERISSQVDKLIGITDKIDSSKQGLNDTIAHLTNVSSKIDESINYQGEIKDKVDNLATNLSKVNLDKIENMFANASKNKEFSIRSKASGDFYSKPVSTGYGGVTLVCIYLYYGEQLQLNLDEVFEIIVMRSINKLVTKSEGDDGFRAYQEGLFIGVWQSLTANDYIYVLNDDEERLYSLHNEFKVECQNFIEFYKSAKDDDDLDRHDEYFIAMINACEEVVLEAAE